MTELEQAGERLRDAVLRFNGQLFSPEFGSPQVHSGFPATSRDSSLNAPGHGHEKPGVWDDDNGKFAGKPCQLCKAWQDMLLELQAWPKLFPVGKEGGGR